MDSDKLDCDLDGPDLIVGTRSTCIETIKKGTGAHEVNWRVKRPYIGEVTAASSMETKVVLLLLCRLLV